jgi:hypothetical protein
MYYTFAPLIQAGIEAGKYVPVISKAGIPLSMVRNAATGKIAAHAIGVAANPLTAVPDLVGLANLRQGGMILQSVKTLSASVATLQATTAVIGVGVAVTGVLAAVNLWQTMKLRKDIKQMRLEVQDGFLNLHKALADQGEEVLRHIDQVAEDVEFRAHRTILVRAYGTFNTALNRLQTAANLGDTGRRNDEITAVRDMLFVALADYTNDQLMTGISPAAYLRRRECVWAIEQAIAMTFQLQGEYSAVSDRLIALDGTIRSDADRAIAGVADTQELDFFFPEILRIHDHDLTTINAWREHIDWYQSLSSSEQQELKHLSTESQSGAELEVIQEEDVVLEMPPEYAYYEQVQQYSCAEVLKDSLRILVDPNRRTDYEAYISERSLAEGLSTLTATNLQKATPVTIANLWYYLSIQNEDEVTENQAALAR